MGHPMKVSEAVERLRVYMDESDGFVSVPNADLAILLASHEALRLAALPFAEAAEHLHPASPNDGETLDGMKVGQWRALSLAVEEASK